MRTLQHWVLIALLASHGILSPEVQAQDDVELTPGFIAGTLQLGPELISRFNVTARSDQFASTSGAVNFEPSLNSVTYQIPVQVESGQTRTYAVSVNIHTDSNKTSALLHGTAVVSPNATTILDFVGNNH